MVYPSSVKKTITLNEEEIREAVVFWLRSKRLVLPKASLAVTVRVSDYKPSAVIEVTGDVREPTPEPSEEKTAWDRIKED